MLVGQCKGREKRSLKHFGLFVQHPLGRFANSDTGNKPFVSPGM